ncbi:MAG TPA: Hsp70 family protein [Dactylosporangium sp.]|jgi:hypothetical protein|nr:Hsp70 family protein [Dactylosporangium sp.]
MVTLGIDFGTSSTVAMVGLDDGRAAPLLFGETPLLPSAVCLTQNGDVLVGRDAVQASRSRPEGFEGHPKSRIDEGEILLGERAVPVTAAIGAVLRRVHDEALRVAGAPVGRLVLTHPAGWGARRRQALLEAAAAAGLPAAELVAEPVAAAAFYVFALRHEVPLNACLVVYDFGAGTFDASVVRRTAQGFEVLAAEGLLDAGGLDLDAAIVAHFGATYGAAGPEAWRRLTAPTTSPDRRLSRTFWDDVRAGKEALSRTAMTTIFLPILEVEAVLGREQLDALAQPLLERTVAATRLAVRNAGIRDEDIASVFLVGGSSRMPLAATLLHQSLGVAPTVIEQPELIVAGGTLHFHRTSLQSPPAAAPAGAPAGAPTSAPPVTAGGPAYPQTGASVPISPVSPFSAPPAPAPVSPVAAYQPPPAYHQPPPAYQPPPSGLRRTVDAMGTATKVLWGVAALVLVVATVVVSSLLLSDDPGTTATNGPTSNAGVGTTTPAAPTSKAAPTKDLQAEAATKVADCERQHKMTKAKQTDDNGAGVQQFKTCEWPPSKLADADGYWEIIVNSVQGPGDSEATGMSIADRVNGPCETFEMTYDYGHMGESSHLQPFKVPRGSIWITTVNGGERWDGDRSTLPFYQDRDEAVVLTSGHYGLVTAACA